MIDQSTWINRTEFYNLHCKEPFIEIFDKNKINQNPKVEVLLITYNQCKYIREALDSILIQETNFNFNILICDDESSDGTTEICKEYQTKYPEKIKLIIDRRINNVSVLGQPCGIHSMVHGFLSLSAKYFAILSGDDYWTGTNKLQKQYDFLEQNEDYVSCFHHWVHRNETTGKMREKVQSGHMPLTHFARNVFEKIPKEFLEVLQEDTFLKAILVEYGDIGFVRGINPSVYRVHDSNMWGDENSLFKWESRILTDRKIQKAFSQSSNNLKYKDNLLENIVGKDDFMTFQKLRKLKRLSASFYLELIKNRVFSLFFKKVIINKISKVKK